MYYSRRSSEKWITGLVIFIVALLCLCYYSTKTYTVTVTGKDVKNDDNSSKYLVFTKLENGETKVFSIENSYFKLRWNSSEVYADIEIGKTYEIKVIGLRIPFFDQYENIMTFSVIEDSNYD